MIGNIVAHATTATCSPLACLIAMTNMTSMISTHGSWRRCSMRSFIESETNETVWRRCWRGPQLGLTPHGAVLLELTRRGQTLAAARSTKSTRSTRDTASNWSVFVIYCLACCVQCSLA
jgi:hypothetical protein